MLLVLWNCWFIFTKRPIISLFILLSEKEPIVNSGLFLPLLVALLSDGSLLTALLFMNRIATIHNNKTAYFS